MEKEEYVMLVRTWLVSMLEIGSLVFDYLASIINQWLSFGIRWSTLKQQYYRQDCSGLGRRLLEHICRHYVRHSSNVLYLLNSNALYRSGIGPEGFAYISSDGNFTGNPIAPDQLKFYNQHGFYVTSSYYILRPEVLESNFYAYRVTGDRKYFDRAIRAVESFNKHLRTNSGYAGLHDVNQPSAKIDDTESFWFAEVLKYL